MSRVMDHRRGSTESCGAPHNRKNWLFSGSDEGGRTTAVLYSLTQTCRRHGIDPFAYLRDVLTRLPQSDFQNLADLFPHRWAKAQRAQSDTPSDL